MPEEDVNEQIERGFALIQQKIEDLEGRKEEYSRELQGKDSLLLERMATLAVPVVRRIGINMLDRGKVDQKGEIYDAQYHRQKMIVLGKVEPDTYRPDDATKKIQDQFCVLGEDGHLYEVMYSSDGFRIDSYLNPIAPEDVLAIYGVEIMFMLYRAMNDYLEGQRDLVDCLGQTLAFLRMSQKK